MLLVPADGAPPDRTPFVTGESWCRSMAPLGPKACCRSRSRLAKAHDADLLIAHVTPAPELTKVGPLTAQDLELEQRVIARNERVARGYLDQIRARVSEAGVVARTVISRSGDARTRLARLVRGERVWISSSSRPTGGVAHGIRRVGAWRPIC